MSRESYPDELMVILPRSSGGKSAYAYAAEGGYAGTEKEFAERLATLLNRPVVGSVDGTDIVLTGDLTPGTYTFAYAIRKADGTTENVPIGKCTVGDGSAPKTYTIRWCNYDGTTLETDTVTEGETPVYNGATPTRAEDDLYTYAFVGWDKAITAAAADAAYTATYAQTVKPVEPTIVNRIKVSTDASGDPFNGGQGWKTGWRLSASSSEEKEQSGYEVTGFIPYQLGQEIWIKGIDVSDDNNNNMGFYNSSKTRSTTSGNNGLKLHTLFVTRGTDHGGGVYSCEINDTTLDGLSASNLAYIRLSSASITDDSIVTIDAPIA